MHGVIGSRAKRALLVGLVVAIFASIGLRAQSFSLISDREPISSLDGLWRFHTGDDPAWADPSFDDSHWPLIRSDESWTKQGYPDYGGYAWYRFSIQEPDGKEPLSLLLTGILTSYRVYADGQLMGGLGEMPPHHDFGEIARRAVYDLPVAGHSGRGTIHIAVRVWLDPQSASYIQGGPQKPGNEVGPRSLIRQRFEEVRQAFSAHGVDAFAYSILASAFGLLALGLFLFRPAEREYLWFALVLLSSGADAAVNLAVVLSAIPVEIFDYIESSLFTVFHIAALLFSPRCFWSAEGSGGG